jgi:hypothetical protein
MVHHGIELKLQITDEKLTSEERTENELEIMWLDGQLSAHLPGPQQIMLENFVRLILENKTGRRIKHLE